MKDSTYMRGRVKGKEKVQPNGPSEEAPRRQRFFLLKSRNAGENTSGDVSGAYTQLNFHVYDFMH